MAADPVSTLKTTGADWRTRYAFWKSIEPRLSLVRLSLARLSLARLSLARLSLARLSLARLSLTFLSLPRSRLHSLTQSRRKYHYLSTRDATL